MNDDLKNPPTDVEYGFAAKAYPFFASSSGYGCSGLSGQELLDHVAGIAARLRMHAVEGYKNSDVRPYYAETGGVRVTVNGYEDDDTLHIEYHISAANDYNYLV